MRGSEASPAADAASDSPEGASLDVAPFSPEDSSADIAPASPEGGSADAAPASHEGGSADIAPVSPEGASAEPAPVPVEPSFERVSPAGNSSAPDLAAVPESPASRIAEPNPDPEAVQRLIVSGIPAHHAPEVADILSGCRHLRDSYNHLRQAYGNETGKKYQEIIRQAGLPLGRKAAGRS